MRSWPEPRLTLLAVFSALALGARAEPTFFLARVAPIFDQHCTQCHGETKQKGGLRLDSFASLMKGGDSGVALKPGDVKGSDLLRRVKLPRDDDEAMPADGKPALSANEIKVLEIWIGAGASDTAELGAFTGVPLPEVRKAPAPPLAPDWHPRAAQIAALEKSLGVKLVARSQVATDGLVLRTASAPAHCNDAALAQLAPVADLIVDAELARTKITDAGLPALASWKNLRRADLSATKVSSEGLGVFASLANLEALNLTGTQVDAAGVDKLKTQPALKGLWYYATPAQPALAESNPPKS